MGKKQRVVFEKQIVHSRSALALSHVSRCSRYPLQSCSEAPHRLLLGCSMTVRRAAQY
jgi:hypothetical protein